MRGVKSVKLNHPSMAGTLESSDIQILLSPADQGIELHLESSVLSQYGLQIRQTILEVLEKLEVTDAKVVAIDKGALDCTIRSRVQTAVFRAVDQTENLPWGVSM